MHEEVCIWNAMRTASLEREFSGSHSVNKDTGPRWKTWTEILYALATLCSLFIESVDASAGQAFII